MVFLLLVPSPPQLLLLCLGSSSSSSINSNIDPYQRKVIAISNDNHDREDLGGMTIITLVLLVPVQNTTIISTDNSLRRAVVEK
mmetsp:Transcript_10759/g.17334  ORF Transcript_10759/g.17334 Transcript_10759/m.17334 type:complete len:84 (+) Transcript_10759:1666-1917(+)